MGESSEDKSLSTAPGADGSSAAVVDDAIAASDLTGRLRASVETLASFERGSASDGEKRAAEWLAAQLLHLGLDARVERERAVGNYWLPFSLMSGLAFVGALLFRRGSRAAAALAGAVGAAAVWDDVGHGRRWFRHALLPHRPTYNVVCETGDPDAERTLVFVSHHDAAKSGLIFHPGVVPWVAERFPKAFERTNTSPPVTAPIAMGPALVAAGAASGSRLLVRAGVAIAALTQTALADVARHPVVPGANDNLAACAVLLELARVLATERVKGLRVILVSTGSEESNSEGMYGFAHRHFPQLPRESTAIVILEGLGSPHLTLLEGEGMLWMRDYSQALNSELHSAARDLGIKPRRGLRFRNSTDGIFALRAGYPAAMLGSINDLKVIDNYHWPTDTPENVDYTTAAAAAGTCVRLIERLSTSGRWGFRPHAPTREWRFLSALRDRADAARS